MRLNAHRRYRRLSRTTYEFPCTSGIGVRSDPQRLWDVRSRRVQSTRIAYPVGDALPARDPFPVFSGAASWFNLPSRVWISRHHSYLMSGRIYLSPAQSSPGILFPNLSKTRVAETYGWEGAWPHSGHS